MTINAKKLYLYFLILLFFSLLNCSISMWALKQVHFNNNLLSLQSANQDVNWFFQSILLLLISNESHNELWNNVLSCLGAQEGAMVPTQQTGLLKITVVYDPSSSGYCLFRDAGHVSISPLDGGLQLPIILLISPWTKVLKACVDKKYVISNLDAYKIQ